MLPVLMYHSISADSDDPYCIRVRPQCFEAQMRLISRLGLRGVSMRELRAAEAHRSWRAARLVGLTFDDGYADFAEHALPVLLRYGFTATVFALAGRLGGENSWDPDGPRRQLMTASMLRSAAEAGMEVGSHGLLHVSLPEASDTELADEVRLSRSQLREVTGQSVDGFAYPFGHVNVRVARAVRAAGYDYACAIWKSDLPARYTLTRTAVQDPHLLTRLIRAAPRVLAESGPRVTARKVTETLARCR